VNEWPNEPGEGRRRRDPDDPFPMIDQPTEAGPVVSRTVCIRNKRGLHARAAAKFVKLAEQFSACVTVRKNGHAVSARSIMGLMMLGASAGCDVVLEAEGWDAREALEALAGLVEAGFDED
jgi:phosphocarrier protein HPr